MTRTPGDVPEAELAVLGALWERGPATRRQVADVLYPRGGPSAYATVQKLLERLIRRGLVRMSGTEEQRLFTASVNRDELIGRQLQDMAERLCGGSLAPLVMNLVKVRPLTPAELDELRRWLEGQAPGKRSGGRKED